MLAPDTSFAADAGLHRALELLFAPQNGAIDELPATLPECGLGEAHTLELLSGHVLGQAAQLDSPTALAHMDPPTPWITWAMALWNARLNQNLLHEATSPFASRAEAQVLAWLAPYFGMQGGHCCAGSTLANLTAIWAARDAAGIKTVVASQAAHLSIEKACHLLGLPLVKIPVDRHGRLDREQLPSLDQAGLVLTAGTTATGAIDPLNLAGSAKWTHVDAAWAGPLRLSPTHHAALNGIEKADSVAISAHNWLFQPKDSALIMFRNLAAANAAISLGGAYLAKPNIGIQGSRSAAAIPLLATLLAWGHEGLAQRLDKLMALAGHLADAIEQSDDLVLWAKPQTAINVFRPARATTAAFIKAVPAGLFSTCTLDGETWVRSVAANPSANLHLILQNIRAACGNLPISVPD